MDQRPIGVEAINNLLASKIIKEGYNALYMNMIVLGLSVVSLELSNLEMRIGGDCLYSNGDPLFYFFRKP